VFDPHVAYSFGITVSIGLLSGPAGDQKFWQRAFAFREKTAFRGFLLGAALFAVVPISMSVLGFIAAGSAAAAPAVASGAVTAQQVGPEVVRTLLPDWGLVVFVVIVLAGLTATGDSALCAGGSLIAVDIYRKYMNPAASETQMVRVSRWSTAGMCVVGICIALVPGITILSLFLFYGTLRSAVLAPTIFALCSTRVTAWGIFLGVVCASVMGVPSYVYGELTGSVDVKIAANIGIVIVSTLAPLISIFIGERSDEMPILQQ
jgi:Na+/proline symporter